MNQEISENEILLNNYVKINKIGQDKFGEAWIGELNSNSHRTILKYIDASKVKIKKKIFIKFSLISILLS